MYPWGFDFPTWKDSSPKQIFLSLLMMHLPLGFLLGTLSQVTMKTCTVWANAALGFPQEELKVKATSVKGFPARSSAVPDPPSPTFNQNTSLLHIITFYTTFLNKLVIFLQLHALTQADNEPWCFPHTICYDRITNHKIIEWPGGWKGPQS